MKVKLQLGVFMLLIHTSLAVWQRKAVMKGKTLELLCPIKPQSQSDPVEWRNPDGVKDKRYSLVQRSKFIVRISDVTFSDGGNYTCTHYLQHAVDKTVEVTVLAQPRAEIVTRSEGIAVIKCTAEGNYPPPAISWQIRNGPEFHTHADITQEDKKFVATEMLKMSTEKATDVKCIVRHPALVEPLTDVVKIRRNRKTYYPRTTTSLPKMTPALKTTREVTTDQFTTSEKEASGFSTTAPFSTRGKTKYPRTTTSLPKMTPALKTTREVTTDHFTTTEKEASGFSITAPFSTREADDSVATNVPLTTSQFNTSDGSSVVLHSSTTQNETSGIWNTTGFTTIAARTNTPFNETNKSSTEIGHDVERQKEGNASLLVFLVTCLILGLLVVVIFIFIKLRRAHIAWKRENDDSDTSESSAKSKASQEDKNTQRRRGFFNTGITQYVIQEPTAITSVSNPGAMASLEETAATEQSPPAPPPPQTTVKPKVKETEL